MNVTQTAAVLDRPAASGPETGAAGTTAHGTGAGAGAANGTENRAPVARARRDRDADGMAVASFVLGLTGLLVFNLLLGPVALVLGGLALLRGTARRGRAALGMALGVADLVVLGVLVATSGTISWSITG